MLWLEAYLSSQWQEKSIIVVSHDASFLEAVCTDIVHLDNYQLNYYSGSYWNFAAIHDKIEAKKVKDYNIQQAAIAEIKKSVKPEKVEQKVKKKLNIPILAEKPKEYRVSFRMNSPTETGTAVELRKISFCYGGGERPLFSDLTVKIDTYSRISIVGPNGVILLCQINSGYVSNS